ncbi:malate dehydrogenase (oxaloacetate-decarboxylating)(NADP+) [Methylohalomonas lacus]|uniref:NADP-dependent malic enzyme n=1 Tax=Methylohalomonas lacus TaxID=398773 RepID=A0AAE3L0Z4_9GAMM|nr:NADP-dependent malic enzyme [Methylohalomonas lacus]MCS3902411.1 malate dehydrogenase (oxaloacetate-decarboxylating)(NADP+) [Methylohalomonas lacus]
MNRDSDKNALDYHRYPRPGKIEVTPTKPLANQRDLALAYSPGVAAACEAIVADPASVADMTARSNLVAVVTNGTAVLGLGDIGPLAAKPVMEGKAVLFKKFAGIDVFDIEINERDPEKLVDIIASLEPSFGGINLEDIKSPECFMVEGRLRNRMNIPVFHDDQHGTAIIVGAAVLNGLRVVGKDIKDVKLVSTGAGASGIACLKVLEGLGLPKENMRVFDRDGLLHPGRRGGLEPHKKMFATKTGSIETLSEAMQDADIFLGLSGPGVLKQEMVRSMARDPLILALSNPLPEILPEEAQAVRPDAILATGRSDYPNQVNNVLCFPFIFRGALDVGATIINDEMKLACVYALAELAMEEAPDTVVAAYGGIDFKFGRDYLIPKPFDPRLILKLAPAVAMAASDSGVALRPLTDVEAYRQQLQRYVFESVLIMRPVFERAKSQPKRIVYAEGEQPLILRAVQSVVDEQLARPVLIGDAATISERINQLGLRLRPDTDIDIVAVDDPTDHNSQMAARMVHAGQADGIICGYEDYFHTHLQHIVDQLGLASGVAQAAAMNIVILKQGVYFICDTAVTPEPDAEQLADMTLLAANVVRRFGMTPRAALLAHGNAGAEDTPVAARLRQAVDLIRARDAGLEVDGPSRADAALNDQIRQTVKPDSPLHGQANLLIMPNIDAAKIGYDLIKELGEAVTIGPVLLGLAHPVHLLTGSATVRRVVNATALAVVDAQVAAVQSHDN